ncbi:hypothetical protein TUM20983_54230 [Mycobacterium antarcticum]|uniref:hypothetical protein n=1 Tax=Mycolicibacterium sp. TUM20983 TaxID=3023369 RepID=UPI00238ACC05|nr:hypothetical protein [Mycolicibacterium sp. TUM20983]GLP78313.1 hypothetical protein TUM20983_54230 [Mycolicibacterium sp. TUM20983]
MTLPQEATPQETERAGALTTPTPTPSERATPTPGWRLAFLAGLAPLAAGIVTLVTTWLAITRPDEPWWTGIGDLGFSYASLSAAGSGADAWVQLNASVGGVNIVAGAIAVMTVAAFALRSGQRWAWWFLAFSLLWVGLHDATMATLYFLQTGQPVMLLPYLYCALLAAGLMRSRRIAIAR